MPWCAPWFPRIARIPRLPLPRLHKGAERSAPGKSSRGLEALRVVPGAAAVPRRIMTIEDP
jgi:hypothetical protein